MKIILLGPPGSGKGTVSERLVQDYNLIHISAGEILREEVQKKTTLGKEIKKYIEKGNLVPDQFVAEIVKLGAKGKKNYILDGFPRTIAQAKEITDLNIDLVIYLDVPEQIVIERLAGRRTCKKGDHTYHLTYLPPKKRGICDYDKTKLLQRKDDQPDVVKERFRVYHEKTQPVIDYYKKKRMLRIIDAAPTPEKAYKNVRKIIEDTFK